jgi:hypothetical protein
MPWRKKPNERLRYWFSGSPAKAKADGFKTILVYCVIASGRLSVIRARVAATIQR